MCLLLRGDTEHKPAKDQPPPSVLATSRDSCCATRRCLDALPSCNSERRERRQGPRGRPRVARKGQPHARRLSTLIQDLLRPTVAGPTAGQPQTNIFTNHRLRSTAATLATNGEMKNKRRSASTCRLEMHTINSLTTESPTPFPSFCLEDFDDSFRHHSLAFVVGLSLRVLSRINVNANRPRVCA